MTNKNDERRCLRDPIPQISDAARYLDAAISAHQAGRPKLTDELIRLGDMPEIRDWTESLWGANSPYVRRRKDSAMEKPSLNVQGGARMPTAADKKQLHERDGFHCRFCGIPVIRMEIRAALRREYPEALPWGRRNVEQHAAFQAMWLQYDHLIPHARGGDSNIDNMLITCAPCNYGRWNYLVEEVGLLDPRQFDPIRSPWDGLERVLIARVSP